MIRDFINGIFDVWDRFIASFDTAGGHVFLFVALYIGMSAFHCSETDRQGVLQALFLVLRPGGTVKQS